MASFNSLPDLSTVDLKAIQDSEPVHPRISFSPLTTIAENWDCAESNERNLNENDHSSTEEEDTSDYEDRGPNSSLRKARESKSFYTSCSSASIANSFQETSDSELSDGTSDSESSSSDSDSDSASVSSASSCGENHKFSPKKDKSNFSVREATYDKGRVTLRLSTLQLEKDHPTIAPSFTGVCKPQPGHLIHQADTFAYNSTNGLSHKNKLQPLSSPPSKHTVVQEGSVKQASLSPSSRARQLRHTADSRPSRNTAAPAKPSAVAEPATSTSKTTSRRSQTNKKQGVPSSVKTKENPNSIASADERKVGSARERTQRPPSSSAGVEPCLGDLDDSDSDELTLPAVSEAIRMLDLDSQGSGAAQQGAHQPAPPAASLLGPALPKLPFVFGANGFLNQNTWPGIGYCSSLLQQFVAKSQLGEPPPPPPTTLLPTKGARKCFPPLDDVPAFASSGDSAAKQTNEPRQAGASQDAEVDLMVPMRGLDCHSSHVSPDSGIQSVSGSPFSAHSSPLHPSAVASAGNQAAVTVAPPGVRSPSPSRGSHKKGRNPGQAKSVTATRASAGVVSPTSKRVDGAKAGGKSSRRPRSCRDTASALSSGLNKDSSIVQAIQRGMNAALRLSNNACSDVPSFKGVSQLPLLPELPKKSSETNHSTRKAAKCSDESKNSGKTSRTESRESSTVKSTARCETDRPASNEPSSSVPRSASRGEKRKKKKKKKHKSETVDNGECTIDPSMVPLVEQLCTRLDRCAISRGSCGNSRKRPFIFDRRKYALGSMASLGVGRSKRRKLEEEQANQANRVNAKRRGKSKKCPAPQTAPSTKNPAVESEPTVAAAAAAVVLTAVELLLPLKKRHHHLPAPELQASESGSENVLSSDSASEKPSHESFARNDAAQIVPTNARKRAANHESPNEAVHLAADDKVIAGAPKPAKKGRGRKKAKLEVSEKPIEADNTNEEEHGAIEAARSDTVRDQVARHGEHPTKKRNRRRKAINRTGFPSVKKKRKKTASPLPSVAKPSVVEDSRDEEPLPLPAKRLKEVSRNSSEDGSLPDPASSETPSSDELSQAPATNEEPPKKRRGATSLRKRYLPAGLLSNFFKEETDGPTTSNAGPADRSKGPVYDSEEHEYGLLPPPFYCEKYLRRTKRDFQLPYDVWLLHQQGKLRDRDSMVPSWNYRKIRTNVYYDVKPPYSNDAQACNCTLPKPDAKDPESQCCGEDCLNRMVYTECSPQMCPVGDKCANQQIQRHRWAQGLERFMTNDKGWGVRCRNPLRAGQFILEYVGEVVSDKEFKERMHTIYVHDTHHYCLHLDGGLVIDGHRMGGDGRFVNHSCAPNCEMQKWSVNGLPRMALFAMEDIPAMQELSYDYNFSLFNPAEGQPCKCGSVQCRGVIGGKSQRVVPITDPNASKQPMKIVQPKRKRKALQQGKTSVTTCLAPSTLRPLSMQQRSFVLQRRCFLLRNLDKVREWRDRQKERIRLAQQQQQQNPANGRTRRLNSRPSLGTMEKQESFEKKPAEKSVPPQDAEETVPVTSAATFLDEEPGPNEEVVRCRCKLFDDEGLMVQCEKCETWQHSDCLGAEKAKAALEDEHYVCSECLGVAPTKDDLDVVLTPQPDNPPDGLTFYLSLYYKDLHVRQGDCVYVLRDHDTPDSEKTLWSGITETEDLPTPRPPHRLPSHVKVSNLDIFQIERLWIDENGKKFVWGHHFFRPQDTYHEPSRKFYVNEVLHSPITEAIPVWAVAGRCWVLDPVTFCKGRPMDAVEEHVYISEYRVDRTARLFSKNARSKFPICTRHFAFRNFATRLKPQRTFQPHALPAPGGRKSSESCPGPKGDKSKKAHQSKGKNSAVQERIAHEKTNANKRAERRVRLEKMLDQLLAKNSTVDGPVEDASHLLQRGRGRARGRSSNSKARISTPCP